MTITAYSIICQLRDWKTVNMTGPDPEYTTKEERESTENITTDIYVYPNYQTDDYNQLIRVDLNRDIRITAAEKSCYHKRILSSPSKFDTVRIPQPGVLGSLFPSLVFTEMKTPSEYNNITIFDNPEFTNTKELFKFLNKDVNNITASRELSSNVYHCFNTSKVRLVQNK